MASAVESLLNYVPRRLALRCRAGRDAAAPDEFDAAVLFADISGFTALVDRLSRRGAAGIEELSSSLGGFFKALLQIIESHGGDVLKMRGDALVVAWEWNSADTASDAILRATACALDLQEGARGFSASDGGKMAVRIGIGAGRVRSLTLGGYNERWEFAPTGEPLKQMGLAQGRATPGEVVLSPEAHTFVRDLVQGVDLDGGFVRATGVKSSPARVPLAAANSSYVHREALEGYLSRPVRFIVGGEGEAWLSDVRQVTSLFVTVAADSNGSFPDKLHRATEAMQKATARFEGSILGWGIDEKGASLINVFGLPPCSHEDDPFRALEAAHAARAALREQGIEAGFGVATGRAFCGPVGSSNRREYAVTGTIVNLAARLAQQSGGEIYCDQATFHSVSARYQFSALPPMRLKGLSNPVPVFQPIGAVLAGPKRSTPMVGHRIEYDRLIHAAEELKAGSSFVGIIEGEAGMGKSTLLAQWGREAANAGVKTLAGGSESIHSSTPYFAWREALSALFDFREGQPARERIDQLLDRSRGAEWERLAPLLNDILDIGLADNAITAQISGKIRADNTRELVVKLLAAESSRQPMAIILEDCHWMDSASLALASAVAESVRPVMLVLSSRPIPEGRQPALESFAGRAGVERLILGPLSPGDCVALAAQRLCVRSIAGSIADLISAKSQGNPFFAIEIAFALREGALVMIDGDECKPVAGIDLANVRFPDNVQGIIMRRIDGLEPSVQLAAKVASVVGRTFSVPLVREPYPVESGKPHVEVYLGKLRDERLVLCDDATTYAFSHALVEEAIYERMLASQRKPLHEAVATTVEKINAADLESVAPVLGHHWSKAGHESKAGRYFGLAGQRAIERGAYQEGLGFLDKAIAMTPVGDKPADQLRQGRWQRMRAEALLGLGKLEESGRAFCECARILGRPVPENVNATIFQQVAKRVGSLMVRSRKKLSDDERECLRELAQCYEMLSLLNLFGNKMAASLNAAFETLRCAEALGPSAEYARALATMSLACSLVPARPIADRYARKALQVASGLKQEMTSSRVGELTAMYFMGDARWEEAEDSFTRAIEGFKVVGDKRRQIECTCLLSTWHHYKGNFARRVELGKEVFRLALSSGDLQAQAWGLLDQIESLLNLGDFGDVREIGQALRRHIGQNIYGADDIMAYGLLAALELRTGRFEEAVVCADKALAIMTKVTPTIVYNLESYAAVAEVYFTGCAREDAGSFADRAKQAAGCVRDFGRVFKIGKSRAEIVTARESELAGDTAAAIKLTRRGLASAIELGMPYEEALARRQFARLLPAGDQRREGELEKALALFRKVAAAYDVQATVDILPARA